MLRTRVFISATDEKLVELKQLLASSILALEQPQADNAKTLTCLNQKLHKLEKDVLTMKTQQSMPSGI